MTTAVEWESENAAALDDMIAALKNSDPYLAAEILDRIAPYPQGENAAARNEHVDTVMYREVEVRDPKTGALDNPNGPAHVKTNGTREWYTHGMLHNEAGPAIIRLNGEVEYYYLGTKCKDAAELDAMVERAHRHAARSKTINNA